MFGRGYAVTIALSHSHHIGTHTSVHPPTYTHTYQGVSNYYVALSLQQ